jgi:cell division protein FtsB
MPSARSAHARSDAAVVRRPTRAPRPRRVQLRSSVVRVRWERVGRIALLVVLTAVVGLYAERALSYVSTHEQASQARAQYVRLAGEHHVLQAQQRSLGDPATIVQRARALGMTRAGEQPYAMTGEASP